MVSGSLHRDYRKLKKKVENGLKGQKPSFLTMSRFGPFVDHFFGEAPPPPLCQHSRPRGPVTCSRTRTHKCRYGTLVRPSTLWCVKKIGANVARTLEGVGRALSLPGVFKMCSKWSKTGSNASKMAQNGSKWCQNGPKGVREGQNGG